MYNLQNNLCGTYSYNPRKKELLPTSFNELPTGNTRTVYSICLGQVKTKIFVNHTDYHAEWLKLESMQLPGLTEYWFRYNSTSYKFTLIDGKKGKQKVTIKALSTA